jgi:hypothetical protein
MNYDSLVIVPNKASPGASRNHGPPFSIIVTILPVCCLSFLLLCFTAAIFCYHVTSLCFSIVLPQRDSNIRQFKLPRLRVTLLGEQIFQPFSNSAVLAGASKRRLYR